MIEKQELKVPKPFKVDTTPLYRYQRTGAFIYVEGNENPINLRKIEATGNPTLNKQILNQRVDNLWYESNPAKEKFLTIMIIAIVVGIIIFAAIQYFFNKQPPTVIPS